MYGIITLLKENQKLIPTSKLTQRRSRRADVLREERGDTRRAHSNITYTVHIVEKGNIRNIHIMESRHEFVCLKQAN
jgi:hypothetical protein